MKKDKPTLSVLVTTMNGGIDRVINELLPRLKEADEIIISHQITNSYLEPCKVNFGKKVKYVYMFEKGLSRNRNFGLSYATGDICYICDDDLLILQGFVSIIKTAYVERDSDVITFQAQDEIGDSHFKMKEGDHNNLSILRIWSWGITFDRQKIIDKEITFDVNFGLGAKYPVGEENIFLRECLKKSLSMIHIDKNIVEHPKESSGIDYRDELILARIKVWIKLFGIIGGIFAVFYFTIFHYKFYNEKYSVGRFFILSLGSLCNGK